MKDIIAMNICTIKFKDKVEKIAYSDQQNMLIVKVQKPNMMNILIRIEDMIILHRRNSFDCEIVVTSEAEFMRNRPSLLNCKGNKL